MKAIAALILAATASWAMPLSASGTASLTGVADEESTIPPGGATQIVKGKGDVLFVRDSINRWYRLQLNKGCLNNLLNYDDAAITPNRVSGRIDGFSRVIYEGGRTCAISSIRRSVPPPQVDSKSVVTLD